MTKKQHITNFTNKQGQLLTHRERTHTSTSNTTKHMNNTTWSKHQTAHTIQNQKKTQATRFEYSEHTNTKKTHTQLNTSWKKKRKVKQPPENKKIKHTEQDWRIENTKKCKKKHNTQHNRRMNNHTTLSKPHKQHTSYKKHNGTLKKQIDHTQLQFNTHTNWVQHIKQPSENTKSHKTNNNTMYRFKA